ncbi:MAG: hypothetical protein WCF98_05325 [Synechococcus sp. ELA057]|jgi:hypothetical protein
MLVLGTGLIGAVSAPLAPVLAQGQTAASGSSSSAYSAGAVSSLLARGDAAAAAGNLTEAKRLYDDARNVSKNLQSFYRSISGAFRGLDARIPREMDDKGRQALDLLTQANLRLAALLRRQGQSEVAVPLLVEVVSIMTPASEQGRKAYQQLVEIGFVTTPYTAPSEAGK